MSYMEFSFYDGKPLGGWPGTEYCGLKFAKLAAAAAAAVNPERLPALKPGGNWLITCAKNKIRVCIPRIISIL